MRDYITIIGGGLAGCEAAYQIAKRGIKVKLYEMKPTKFSPAHSNENLAEIVCSNSFKSNLHTNACGLLKEELRLLDSLLIKCADETSVPAGQALAVDRDEFSKLVTRKIKENQNIEIINKEYTGEEIVKEQFIKTGNVEKDIVGASLVPAQDIGITIIATGPLTTDDFAKNIAKITQEDKLHFYDAVAPIISRESIDMNIAFFGDRYEQEREKEEGIEDWNIRRKTIKEGSYINLPMNKEEYEDFWNELVNAEVVELHEFEKREIFEGCMPVEVMAKRGIDTLRYGPLKPVGFTDPRTGRRPYALVQLRQDDTLRTMFNIVGFQTNLKFGEQKRVFSKIPGLTNAEFIKYGVMHRNTYINSSKLLEETYSLKKNSNLYFAGQITGVEGYVESIASGMVASLNAINRYKYIKEIDAGKGINNENEIGIEKNEIPKECKIIFPENTMIGALSKYISTPNEKFQPMNANFGIMPTLEERIKDKKLKYGKIADRAIEALEEYMKNLENDI